MSRLLMLTENARVPLGRKHGRGFGQSDIGRKIEG